MLVDKHHDCIRVVWICTMEMKINHEDLRKVGKKTELTVLPTTRNAVHNGLTHVCVVN